MRARGLQERTYRMIDILDYFIWSKFVLVSNSLQSLLSWVSIMGLDLGS